MEHFELFGFKFKYERSESYLGDVAKLLQDPKVKSKEEIEAMCRGARLSPNHKFPFDIELSYPKKRIDLEIYYTGDDYKLKRKD